MHEERNCLDRQIEALRWKIEGGSCVRLSPYNDLVEERDQCASSHDYAIFSFFVLLFRDIGQIKANMAMQAKAHV